MELMLMSIFMIMFMLINSWKIEKGKDKYKLDGQEEIIIEILPNENTNLFKWQVGENEFKIQRLYQRVFNPYCSSY